MADPAEIVEGGHFEVRAGKRSRQLLADSVKKADAGLFFDALGEKFFRSRCAFLRRRLIARLTRVHGTLFITAYMKNRPCFRPIPHDGRVRLWGFAPFGNLPI